MYILTLSACTLGTVAKIVDTGHRPRLPRPAHWRVFDDNSGFFSTLKVRMYV